LRTRKKSFASLKEVRKPLAAYAARSLDDSILRKSSSGGVVSELSKMVLKEGGVVVGAKWSDDFLKVDHVAVNAESDLQSLQGSKYLVSDLHNAYGEIKGALESGRRVLFIGTPCQTYAIRHKFGSNGLLLVCAIACFGNVPSIIWRKYVSCLEARKKSKIKHVVFRDNSCGWKNSRFVVDFVNATSINERLYDNEYMKVFLSGWANMQSCLACQFRNGSNGADLLVGDFWGIDDVFPDMSDNKGVNVILAYSALLIDKLKRLKLDLREVKYEQAVAKNPFIEVSPHINLRQRRRFQKNIYKLCFSEAARIAAQEGIFDRIIGIIYRVARKVQRMFRR
jgi:coenzyme F420-reducing hydrogenase beta subunit